MMAGNDSIPVLIVHGGGGAEIKSKRRKQLIQSRVKEFLDAAYSCLLRENSIAAVTKAVSLFEDDPLFNAGTGAVLQADGKARLSASIMDAKTSNFAGIINVRTVKNPVMVARILLNEPSKVLEGQGAERFARMNGFPVYNPCTSEAVNRWKRSQSKATDTVGACALDAQGSLASATSTGGRGMEHPGRVSDSATPAGNYASLFCAASATGYGEDIMSEALAVRLVQRVTDGTPLERAIGKTFGEVRKKKRLMAAIALDRHGNIAVRKTTESLIYGWKKGSRVFVFS